MTGLDMEDVKAVSANTRNVTFCVLDLSRPIRSSSM